MGFRLILSLLRYRTILGSKKTIVWSEVRAQFIAAVHVETSYFVWPSPVFCFFRPPPLVHSKRRWLAPHQHTLLRASAITTKFLEPVSSLVLEPTSLAN